MEKRKIIYGISGAVLLIVAVVVGIFIMRSNGAKKNVPGNSVQNVKDDVKSVGNDSQGVQYEVGSKEEAKKALEDIDSMVETAGKAI